MQPALGAAGCAIAVQYVMKLLVDAMAGPRLHPEPRRVAREHSAPVALLRLARRRVGRARREVARRRQRPDR